MSDLNTLMEGALRAKERAFSAGYDFTPLVQMGKDDGTEMLVFIRSANDKSDMYVSLKECLFVFCVQGYDTFRFVSDAFMSNVSKDEWDSNTSPMPSQDPNASECISITEWKSGVNTMYAKVYHVTDDGEMQWDDLFTHESNEGRIPDMIQKAMNNPPGGPPFSSLTVAGLFLQERGHTIMVPDDG